MSFVKIIQILSHSYENRDVWITYCTFQKNFYTNKSQNIKQMCKIKIILK